MNVNQREARYKIRDYIRQRQSELKGALKATQKMGKVLQQSEIPCVKLYPCFA